MAVSALLNVPVSQRFIVYRTHVMNMSEGNDELKSNLGKRLLNGGRDAIAAPPADEKGILSYVTLEELEHTLLQLECKISIAQTSEGANPSVLLAHDDMDIVRLLCGQENYFDALNLARHNFPVNSSSAENSALEFVIDCFAAKCAGDSLSQESSVVHEQFMAVHGCSSLPLDSMSSNGLMESPSLWEYLVKCLHVIDGPAQNWILHKIAVQASLRVTPADPLPAVLTSSHCGDDSYFQDRDKLRLSKRVLGASHVAAPSKCTGNLPSLIRTLVQEGALVEACDLVSATLKKCDPSKKRLEAIPLERLDQLLCACSTAIAIAEEDGLVERSNMDDDSTSPYGRLIRSHNTLQDSIKAYFTKVFVVEISD